MAKPLRDQEFHAVIALPSQGRYAHAIKQMADWQEVWSLRNDKGWVLAADDAGHEVVQSGPTLAMPKRVRLTSGLIRSRGSLMYTSLSNVGFQGLRAIRD